MSSSILFKSTGMKKDNLLIVTVVIYLLGSCTVSVPCEKAKPLNICIFSFPDSLNKTVTLKTFKKNTNFSSIVDSVMIQNSKLVGDSLIVKYPLTSDFDYILYLGDHNNPYKINEINEDFKMRKAGFSSDPSTCVNLIKTYKLNGKVIEVEENDWCIYITY